MKFNELQVETKKSKKRVGRGISAGQGKTAGRGTKGQKARTGKKLAPTFAGGSGTVVRRVPKRRGFKSIHAPAQTVYTGNLAVLAGKTADNNSLFTADLVATPYQTVKIILQGELKAKVTVKAQAASKGAIEAIEKAGGSFEKVEVPSLPPSARKKEEK